MTLGEILNIVLGVDLSNLNAGLNQAKQQVASYAASVNQYGQSLSQAGKSQIYSWKEVDESLGKIRENFGAMLSMANQMSLTAMRTVLAGGAALMVALFPVKEAVEFEKQMSIVAGVTRASSNEMNNLREAAIQMGRETIFSATQAAQAMAVLAKAGFSANEIITMLPATMRLAAAGELTVAEAADVAAQAIHGFNLAAVDMTHVSDVIALSANVSSVSVKDIAESLKYVAPAASMAKMNINEVGAALAVLGNAGIRASMGGTTLRQILLRLTDDSRTYSDALRALGVQIFDVTGKMRPFTDIMTDLAKANVSITQIGQIFTARSAAGVAALTSNVDELRRFTLENQNAAGEAKRLADVMLYNVAGSIEYLKSSLASLSIAVAGPLLGGFKLLIDVLSEVVNAMQRVASFPLFETINVGLGYLISGLGIIATLLASIAAIPFSIVLTPLITLAGTMGGFLLVLGGSGIIISGFLRTMLFLADGLKFLSGAALSAKTDLVALSLAASPVGKVLLSIWGALKAGAGAIIAGGWWTIIALGIGTIVTALILWYTWQDRALAKAKDAADQATINRKNFEAMTATLGQSAVGTAEHDKVIDELIQKYPELAGRIRYTNQTWQEQQQIINSFRTELMVKELEKAVKAGELAGKKYEDLNKKIAALPPIPPRVGPMGELAPKALYWEERGREAAELRPGVFIQTQEDVDKERASRQLEQRKMVEEARLQASAIRNTMQKALDSIDWKAMGKKPLEMFKAPKEAYYELFKLGDGIRDSLVPAFSESEQSVRKVVDQLQAGGTPIKVWVDWLILATEEMRKQNELLEARREPPSTDVDLEAAKKTTDYWINQFSQLPDALLNAKSSTGETVREVIAGTFIKDTEGLDRITGEIPGIIRNMMNKLAMFGPEATALAEEDVKKLIDKYKKLPPGFKVSADLIIAEFKNLAANYDKYITQAFSKPLAVNLPPLSGINVLDARYQQLPKLEGMVELRDFINKYTAGFKNLDKVLSAGFLVATSKSKELRGDFEVITFQEDKMVSNLERLNKEMGKFAGEADQVRKGIAAALLPTEVEVPISKPYKQWLAEAKAAGAEWADDLGKRVDDVLREREKLSKDVGSAYFEKIVGEEYITKAQTTFQTVENLRQRGGIASIDAIAKQDLLKLEEIENKRLVARKELQKIKDSPETANKQIEIDKAEKHLREVEMQTGVELANWQLTKAKEIAQLNIYKIQERLQIVQNELSAAESMYSLKQAEVSAEKEILQTRLSMGTMSGTEFVGKMVELENTLYKEQLNLLDKRLAVARETAALSIAEAEAKRGSQPIEATNAQIRKANLILEKDTLDILNKKKEATANNVKEMEKFVQLAIKARQELVGIGVDLLTKFAWGALQERAAALIRNAREFGELSRKIGEMQIIPKDLKPGETFKADPNFVSTVQAMADAATILRSDWAQPLIDAVRELSGPITAEKANEIKQLILVEIVPKVKAEGDFQIKYKERIDAAVRAITDGVAELVNALFEGGADVKKIANNVFKNIFKAGFKASLESLEKLLIDSFKLLFEKVGGAVGSMVMMAIGLIGMFLTSSKSKSSFTAAGVESGVTAHEAVRGVIAGETSIPIAKISVSLSEAVSPHLVELRKIEQNTRGGGAGSSANVAVTIQGGDVLGKLQDAIVSTIEMYFSKLVMQGG